MNYFVSMTICIIFWGTRSLEGCCFVCSKPTKKQLIADMVSKMQAKEIVLHKRSDSEFYTNLSFTEQDIAYLRARIERRLKKDAQLQERVESLIAAGDEKRRMSLVMTAKRVHSNRKEKKMRQEDRLPSTVAANGLPINPMEAQRETVHDSVIRAHVLVTRENSDSQAQP